MIDLGTSCCKIPEYLTTTLTALHQHFQVLRVTSAYSPPSCMISGGFKISTVCSLQFAAVNRNNVKNIFSVHRVVWAINVVTLYRGLTVINPNNISILLMLIYRVIKKSLCTWCLQFRKLQVLLKVLPATLQTFIDKPKWVLGDRVQYSTVNIPNVFCDGHLQLINFVGIFRIYWVCTVIVRSTETFWSPCI